MKTAIITLPIFFEKELLAIIEKNIISKEHLGKDQNAHELIKITYSAENQLAIDKILLGIKQFDQFINEVSRVFEKCITELFTEIGEILKKLDVTQNIDINKISKN